MRIAASPAAGHSVSMKSMAIEIDDAGRWRAVVAHDRRADGEFVYAVGSTGIYCRPSCASRRPRREVVTFFDAPADAERAGFRACRRCKPHDAAVADPWVEKIRRACVYLANVDGHPSLAILARRVGGSPYHLQRNFKRLVGISPREYAEACRLRRGKNRLRARRAINAPMLGMLPTTYRRGGAGMSIRYTIVASPLGRLLIGATPKGVCAVAMGASS